MTRDLRPLTRQVTGLGYAHTAYVVEHHGKVVEACNHRHRSYRTAFKCAQKMTRAARRLGAST